MSTKSQPITRSEKSDTIRNDEQPTISSDYKQDIKTTSIKTSKIKRRDLPDDISIFSDDEDNVSDIKRSDNLDNKEAIKPSNKQPSELYVKEDIKPAKKVKNVNKTAHTAKVEEIKDLGISEDELSDDDDVVFDSVSKKDIRVSTKPSKQPAKPPKPTKQSAKSVEQPAKAKPATVKRQPEGKKQYDINMKIAKSMEMKTKNDGSRFTDKFDQPGNNKHNWYDNDSGICAECGEEAYVVPETRSVCRYCIDCYDPSKVSASQSFAHINYIYQSMRKEEEHNEQLTAGEVLARLREEDDLDRKEKLSLRYLYATNVSKGAYDHIKPKSDGAIEVFKDIGKDYKYGKCGRFAELQTDETGIMLDFDFYQSNCIPQVGDKQIKGICKAVAIMLCDRFNLDVQGKNGEFHILVIQRPRIKTEDGKTEALEKKPKGFKDGLHLIIPSIQLHRAGKKVLIADMMRQNIFNKALKGCSFTNDPSEPFLDQNSAHVPVFVVGSAKKDRTTAYPLYKKLFSFRAKDDMVDSFNTYDSSSYLERVNVPLEFALHNWGCETMITNKDVYDLRESFERQIKEYTDGLNSASEDKEDDDINDRLLADECPMTSLIIGKCLLNFDYARADITKLWLNVIAVVKNCISKYNLDEDMICELLDKFSQRSLKYRDKFDVLSTYKRLPAWGNIDKLLQWLKYDNPDKFLEVSKLYKSIINSTEIKNIGYFEGLRKLQGRRVSQKEVSKWMKSCIFRILNGGAEFLMTKRTNIDIETKDVSIQYVAVKHKQLSSALNVQCFVLNDEYVPPEKYSEIHRTAMTKYENDKRLKAPNFTKEFSYTNLKEMFKSIMKTKAINLYDGAEFYPHLKSQKVNMYGKMNLFAGFPMDIYEAVEQKDFTKSNIYNHIREVLCGGRGAEFENLLDWMADMLQNAKTPVANAQVFYGVQGCGKDTFGLFIDKLIGSDLCGNFNSEDRFFSAFNSDKANKLFIRLNEVSTNGLTKNAKSDTLKGIIDSRTIQIEPKGIDPYKIKHCSRYTFFTNNEDAMRIEDNDRRYTLHKCASHKANDKEYFKAIYAELDDRDMIKSAFDFFATREYDWDTIRNGFNTEYKDEQKLQNISNSLKFIQESFRGNVEFASQDLIELKDKKNKDPETKADKPIIKQLIALPDTLYKTYTEWTKINNYRTYARSTFDSKLSTIGIINKTNKSLKIRIKGSSPKYGIRVDEDVVEKGFQTLMNMPNYKLLSTEVDEQLEEDEYVDQEESDSELND